MGLQIFNSISLSIFNLKCWQTKHKIVNLYFQFSLSIVYYNEISQFSNVVFLSSQVLV